MHNLEIPEYTGNKVAEITLANKTLNSTMSSLVKMETQVDECINLVETRFRELAR